MPECFVQHVNRAVSVLVVNACNQRPWFLTLLQVLTFGLTTG